MLDSVLMKSGDHWEATIQALVANPLRRYLDETRSILVGDGCHRSPFLWLDDAGEPFTDSGVTDHVGEITTRLLGVRVTPHLFRDAAATTLTHISPDAARLTRAILGHTSYKTAEKHYNQARGVEVGRRHASLIEKFAEPLEEEADDEPRPVRKKK